MVLMSTPMSGFSFRLMALQFKIRDLLRPRIDILREAGIKPGFHVLDYGCGPGCYITATAELAGKSGKIFALDINPSAIKMVQNIAAKKHLDNITTILSECKTGLPDSSLDIVLLYDTLHALSDPDCVLEELHRVLRPDGLLSLSDHHLSENEITSKVTHKGLFKLSQKGTRTLTFSIEQQ